MRKFFVIFTIMILSSKWAFGDKIIAIVDETPITNSELQNSKKIMKHFDLLKNLTQEDKKNIDKLVLELIINDKVLENFAKSSGMEVPEEELQATLEALAKGKNMSLDKLIEDLKSLKIDIAAFKNKTKVEILRGKLIREYVARDVDISSKDVESMVLATNYRNANLDLQILTANTNDEKSYKKLDNIRKRIRNCNSLNRISFKKYATLSEISTSINMLSPNIQTLVKDLPIGSPSPVIEESGLKLFVVCNRELEEFSSQDHFNVTNFLGNKKLSLGAQKFFQKIRKKAYVKIVE